MAPGKKALHFLLRAARPIGVDLVQTQRRAVAGVAGEDGADLPIRPSHTQHRQRVINDTAGVLTISKACRGLETAVASKFHIALPQSAVAGAIESNA
jgi:hypothetical protein